MRPLLPFILVCFVATASNAQEIKANPIGILFGDVDIAYEHFIKEDWGIEGLVGFTSRKSDYLDREYKRNAVSFGATGKHYFNPRRGCDRFHLGAYTRFSSGEWKADNANGSESISNTRLSLGFFAGQKWVSKGGISIELALGLGRAFLNQYSDEDFDTLGIDLDFFGRLAVGYRWKNPKKNE